MGAVMRFLPTESDDEIDMQDPTQGAEASLDAWCRAHDARQFAMRGLDKLLGAWEGDQANGKPGTLYCAIRACGDMGRVFPQWLQEAIAGAVVTGSLWELVPCEGDARRMWEAEVVGRLAAKKADRKVDASFFAEIAADAWSEYKLRLTPRAVKERYVSEDRKRYEAAITEALAWMLETTGPHPATSCANVPNAMIMLARLGILSTSPRKGRAPLKKLIREFRKTAPKGE